MTIEVEVCYALPERQIVRRLRVDEASTIKQVIDASGLLEDEKNIDLNKCTLGVFGVIRSLDWIVQQHDRVEIYRPLLKSPQQARRQKIRQHNKHAG